MAAAQKSVWGGGGLIFTDRNWCTESYKTVFFVLYDMREKATWNCHKFVVNKIVLDKIARLINL